ncbi:MAG: hypothetical protein ACE5GD_02500 [Candidatus Geothermarchaeales archaeon]
MRSRKSVSEAVRETIESDYTMYIGIIGGFANYTAIAKKIKPIIESMVNNRSISLASIIQAVSRYARSLQGDNKSIEAIRALAQSTLMIRNDIAELTITGHDSKMRSFLFTLMKLLDYDRGVIRLVSFNLLERKLKLILEAKDIDEVVSVVPSSLKTSIETGLAEITVRLNLTGSDVDFMAGLYLAPLSINGIRILDMLRWGEEITMVFKEEDAPTVHKILINEINLARSICSRQAESLCSPVHQ